MASNTVTPRLREPGAAPEHLLGHAFIAALGEVDDIEEKIVVPNAVDPWRHVDQRHASLLCEEPHHPIVGGVGRDDVVDWLEDGAIEILDFAGEPSLTAMLAVARTRGTRLSRAIAISFR